MKREWKERLRNRSVLRPAGSQGRSLVEILTVLAIAGWAVAVTVPALSDGLRRGRIRAASAKMSGVVQRLRTEAVVRGRSIGIRFDRDRGYEYSFYQDGNGNGIRTAEIRSGVDPWISGPEQLEDRFAGIRFAISVPGPIPEIPPRRGRLKNLDDPIKFGRSDILSCSRFGKCSSGTLYLSAGKFRLAAVRVRGWSTQVMRWEYDPRGKYWKRQ